MSRLARISVASGLIVLVPTIALIASSFAGNLDRLAPGLPDAGDFTRFAVPTVRALHDSAAAVMIGLLALAATALPADSGSAPGALGGLRQRAAQLAGVAGGIWALAGVNGVALSYFDVAGVDPLEAGASQASLFSYVTEITLGQSLAISVVLVMVATTLTWLATRVSTLGVAAIVALGALIPLTVTAHGAVNHEDAVSLLALHLIGATVWVGGLAGVLLLSRRLGDSGPDVMRRYSYLAGWCFAIVAISGVAGGLLRVTDLDALATSYGVLLLAKTAALLLLGLIGWAHRSRTIPRLSGSPRSRLLFVRLAVVELALMASTVGLAVTLGRSSPQPAGTLRSTAESFLGYELPPPLSYFQWFGQWQVDVLWTPVGLLLAVGYLVGVHRWNRSHDPWGASRTVSWLAGCAVLVWATSGAPAVYGRLIPTMHVLEQVLIALVVPFLLVLGQPRALGGGLFPVRSDGSRGLREWATGVANSRAARAARRPVVALGLYAVVLVGYYFTPAVQISLDNNLARFAAMVLFLAAGLNLVTSLTARPAGSRMDAERLSVLGAAVVVHIGVASAVMAGWASSGDWYQDMRLLWGDANPNERFLAGGVLWAGSLAVLLALGVRLTSTRPVRERAGRLVTARRFRWPSRVRE